MSGVRDYHDIAMEFADIGLRNRVRGNAERALAYFEQALDFELEAISELSDSDGLAWSILHRSAGTLALDCRRFRQAEQITTRALAGEPHPEIAEELRDLLGQIYFQRHLDLKGVVLQDDELQLSLSGQEVGSGVVHYSEIYDRIDNTSKLIYRTVERNLKRPFRERGQLPRNIRDGYQTLVSVPRSGSFTVTMKFGSSVQPVQPLPPGILDTASILDELMDLLGLINSSRLDEIEQRIPDPNYLRNFFGLARKIAPDGERVNQVGFTVTRGGEQRSIELTMPASEILVPPPPNPPESPSEPIEIRGILRLADAVRDEENIIRVVDGGQVFTIRVPQGLMNDIVRPMWDFPVVVQAIKSGDDITLIHIDIERDQRN